MVGKLFQVDKTDNAEAYFNEKHCILKGDINRKLDIKLRWIGSEVSYSLN